MSNAQGYSARHLEHSDYYDEGKRIAGRWHGRGAELLGLSGEVRSNDLMRFAKAVILKLENFFASDRARTATK